MRKTVMYGCSASASQYITPLCSMLLHVCACRAWHIWCPTSSRTATCCYIRWACLVRKAIATGTRCEVREASALRVQQLL